MSSNTNDDQAITVAQHNDINNPAEIGIFAESLSTDSAKSVKPQEGNALRKNWWKLLLSFLVTIAVIATGVAFLVIRPRESFSSSNNNNIVPTNSTPKYKWPTSVQYDADSIPILPSLDPSFLNGSTDNIFQNPKQAANNNTLPLDSPFPYGILKIRGVNLGGWLALDPIVSPSYFNSTIPDEQTLSKSLGSQATEKLLEHYDQFISENDFAEIASIGMNHVRIPLGYWAVDPLPNESYVQLLSWQFLLRGIYWARKHGLRVFVVIQWLPGRPNPIPHQVPPNVSSNSDLNVTDATSRGLKIVKALANFFSNPNYTQVVTLLGPVNEPLVNNHAQLLQFYTDSYNAISSAYNKTQTTQTYTVFDSEDLALTELLQIPHTPTEMRDKKNYVFFDNSVQSTELQNVLQNICSQWGALDASNSYVPTITGEWVASMDNCTTYLYGVNTPIPSNCTGQGDLESQRMTIKMLADVQINTFEAYRKGWFYYNWKTENNSTNPKFNYQFLARNGYVPKGSFNLDYTCLNHTG